jgi:diguanylate cyclase (GGDEF)-like protein
MASSGISFVSPTPFRHIVVVGVGAALFGRLRVLLADLGVSLEIVDPAAVDPLQTHREKRSLVILGEAGPGGPGAGSWARIQDWRSRGLKLPILLLADLDPPPDLILVDVLAPDQLGERTLLRSLAWLGRELELETVQVEFATRLRAQKDGGGKDPEQSQRWRDVVQALKSEIAEREKDLVRCTAERDAALVEVSYLEERLRDRASQALPTIKRKDLKAHLEASEWLRETQTGEVNRLETRVAELEGLFEALQTLIAEPGQTRREAPAAVLRAVAGRLTVFEREKAENLGLITRLSHNLALQQVDDQLDDAASRRNALRKLDEALEQARKAGVRLFCLFVTLEGLSDDRRKEGQIAADFLLVQVAQRLKLNQRHRDVLLRYDGASFVLITDADSPQHAFRHAQRVHDAVYAEPIELGTRVLPLRLRIGIVGSEPKLHGDELLAKARTLITTAKNLREPIVIDPRLLKAG